MYLHDHHNGFYMYSRFCLPFLNTWDHPFIWSGLCCSVFNFICCVSYTGVYLLVFSGFLLPWRWMFFFFRLLSSIILLAYSDLLTDKPIFCWVDSFCSCVVLLFSISVNIIQYYTIVILKGAFKDSFIKEILCLQNVHVFRYIEAIVWMNLHPAVLWTCPSGGHYLVVINGWCLNYLSK